MEKVTDSWPFSKIKRYTHHPVPGEVNVNKAMAKFITLFAQTKRAVNTFSS